MMDNKKNILKNTKFGDFDLKNLMNLNGSLLEATKAAIKTKSNDIVLKMMENLTDRPDLWTEFLAVYFILN